MFKHEKVVKEEAFEGKNLIKEEVFVFVLPICICVANLHFGKRIFERIFKHILEWINMNISVKCFRKTNFPKKVKNRTNKIGSEMG